jgi:hypothetical protein
VFLALGKDHARRQLSHQFHSEEKHEQVIHLTDDWNERWNQLNRAKKVSYSAAGNKPRAPGCSSVPEEQREGSGLE